MNQENEFVDFDDEYAEDYFNLFGELFEKLVIKVTGKYIELEDGVDSEIYIPSLQRASISNNKDMIKLLYNISVSSIRTSQLGDFVTADDDGFVLNFAKGYNRYYKELLLSLRKSVSLENLESLAIGYNSEDYILKFVSTTIEPVCQSLRMISDSSPNNGWFNNSILVEIVLTQEDISMYKPEGLGMVQAKGNFLCERNGRELNLLELRNIAIKLGLNPRGRNKEDLCRMIRELEL